ncbi:506_t:CDS:2 [Paraglomus occultum]|uniref:506_t:CDS:1 n=1 Tax=Paraglomus occultum TaxID=144539 RepID=A0A9N8ZJ00_9GLOM|nr:506_t:CDS:2 [Paraglomus occultum]
MAINLSEININFVNHPRSKELITSKLDTSATLEKIREELSQCDENGEPIMEFDMKFCNKEGPHVIQRSKEANFYLHEILDNNNNLYIKRSEKPEGAYAYSLEMATTPDNIIEDFKLGHGLLFDQYGVRPAHKCAVRANWSIKESSKTIASVQLINTHRIRDTYTHANNLTLDEDDPLFNPPEPCSHFKEDNPLYDETLDKAVIFRIDKELWDINLAREDIKPTDEFIEAIMKAVEHNTPHKKLDDVFSEYGHWMNCKIKVGCRLQRFTHFHAPALGNENYKDVQAEWIGGEGLNKILDDWSKRIHPFKGNYLLSADNSLIKLDPRTSSQWSVIERADFVPTYKLLDKSLIAKIEALFSDETEVLMTAEALIDHQYADLCQVKFSKPLLSDAYKVDGEVYNNGEICDATVTLYFASIYGFFLEIEWHEFLEMVEDSHVKWKLSVPTIQDIRRYIPNPRLNGSPQVIGGFLIFRIFFNKHISQNHNTTVAEISSLSSKLWNSVEPNVRETFNQLAEQTMSIFREEVPLIWHQDIQKLGLSP